MGASANDSDPVRSVPVPVDGLLFPRVLGRSNLTWEGYHNVSDVVEDPEDFSHFQYPGAIKVGEHSKTFTLRLSLFELF